MKTELCTDLSRLQKSACQSWQHWEFCSLSLLQSQFPGCLFSSVTIQNDKSLEHFSPGASEMDSLVFCPCSCEGKWVQVICVCVTAKHPHSNHFNKALWCLCVLRAPLFAWVCQSVFRVLRSSDYLNWATIQPRNQFVLLLWWYFNNCCSGQVACVQMEHKRCCKLRNKQVLGKTMCH